MPKNKFYNFNPDGSHYVAQFPSRAAMERVFGCRISADYCSTGGGEATTLDAALARLYPGIFFKEISNYHGGGVIQYSAWQKETRRWTKEEALEHIAKHAPADFIFTTRTSHGYRKP